jgi:hypothetical protein
MIASSPRGAVAAITASPAHLDTAWYQNHQSGRPRLRISAACTIPTPQDAHHAEALQRVDRVGPLRAEHDRHGDRRKDDQPAEDGKASAAEAKLASRNASRRCRGLS